MADGPVTMDAVAVVEVSQAAEEEEAAVFPAVDFRVVGLRVADLQVAAVHHCRR